MEINIEINIESYLKGIKEIYPKFNSSNETLARLAQYVYVCCEDRLESYKCKNCGEYSCSKQDKQYFKFCPRCGESLINKGGK